MEKDAVRRGIGAAHAAGWKACRSDDCGRTALVEKRAADRGALRARFLRDIIVNKRVYEFGVLSDDKFQYDGNAIDGSRRRGLFDGPSSSGLMSGGMLGAEMRARLLTSVLGLVASIFCRL